MLSKKLAAAAFGLVVMGAAPAMAQEAKVYAYTGVGNYCPAGL